ncbi:hypothetical protein [Staphylococcus aureus]|uniref:hypothetical protein n=1 Tax=Staphylococcus aureus TaxID=1280 RepID=UPI000AE51C3F|nr:hypothetical protein [Staphylococcus aureus]
MKTTEFKEKLKEINLYLVEENVIYPYYSSGRKESSPDSCVKCYTMFLPFLLIKIDVFS